MNKTPQKVKLTSQEKQTQRFQELKKSILRDVTGGMMTKSCGATEPP